MVSKTCTNEVDYLFSQIYLVLYSIKCYCLHAIGLKEKKKLHTLPTAISCKGGFVQSK